MSANSRNLAPLSGLMLVRCSQARYPSGPFMLERGLIHRSFARSGSVTLGLDLPFLAMGRSLYSTSEAVAQVSNNVNKSANICRESGHWPLAFGPWEKQPQDQHQRQKLKATATSATDAAGCLLQPVSRLEILIFIQYLSNRPGRAAVTCSRWPW